MTVEFICVGTEILLGNIVNTNAAYLSDGDCEAGSFKVGYPDFERWAWTYEGRLDEGGSGRGLRKEIV